MRLQLTEWTGVALMAGAASFVHIGFSIAIVGVYLFASAVLAQVVGGMDDEETD